MSSILVRDFAPVEYPKFTTHKNYICYMAEKSADLRLSCGNSLRAPMQVSANVTKKIQLIKATLKNLQMESNIVSQHPDYAEVAVSWIPVKSYYLVFNLISLFETFVSTNNNFLTNTHAQVLGNFRDLLRDGSLQFTEPVFNEVRIGSEIEAMQVTQSDNLRASTATRREQIFRKLADYAKQELRRRSGTNRLGGSQMREFRGSDFALFDLFYWYRIKVNYRDLEFMEERVPTSEFQEFHQNYYSLTKNFYNAIKQCLDEVAVARTGAVLF